MMSHEDALLELDGALEDACVAVVEKLESLLSEGIRVSPTDIASLIIDEPFHELTEHIEDVLRDLAGDEGENFEMESEAFVAASRALDNTQQHLWEVFDAFFQSDEYPSEEEAKDTVEEIFHHLREEIAEIVEGVACPTSSSSESWMGEEGVILPLARRRGGDGRAP